jgi:hypothetical protein
MADMATQSGIASASASASASSASCEGGSASTTVSIHAAAAVAGLSFDGGSSSRPLVQPTFANVPPPPPPAPVAEEELEDDDDQAEAAAERLMQSVERGFAAAKAKGGDRRTLYDVSVKAFRAMEDLYPEFKKLSAADSAFEVTLEIEGLNEFYAEFAEFGKAIP